MTEIVSVQHVGRRRRWPVIAITSAIVVAIAIVAIAVASQSSSAGPADPAEAVDAGGSATSAAPPAPETAAPPAPATAAPPVKGAGPARGAAAEPAATGPCKIAFSSSPDGAEIMIGGKVVGITPVTLELPCKPTAAFFNRDRYQTETRRFEPTPGQQEIAVTLERPSFTVTITSSPSGAKIMVAGAAVGTTPGKITVPGFEGTPVEIVKPGFRPHRERVYATKSGHRVEVRLRRK